MAIVCDVCKKLIYTRRFLVCSCCKKNYDLSCSNVSFERFKIMTKEHRDAWKCDLCWEEFHKGNHMCGPTTSTTNTNMTPNNNTHCQEVIVNVSTENSFASLSSEDISDNESDDHTIVSPRLNRSCPQLDLCCKDDVENLEIKIINLESKLLSADNEIQNILSENYALRKKVSDYELKIHQLTLVCKGTNKNHAPLSKSTGKKDRRRTKRRTLNFSADLHLNGSIDNLYNLNQEGNNSSQLGNEKEKINNEECQKREKENVEIKQKSQSKIIILGNEHLRGLSAMIMKSRLGKWNDRYTPSSFIKSNAMSATVLEQCSTIEQNLSSEDVVILGCGGHDTNPSKLHNSLCIALEKLKKASVYIVPVAYSESLNEKTLNYHLKLWSQNFDNCKFIDFANCYYASRYDYLNYICNKININIDYNVYKMEFLSRKNELKTLQGDTLSQEDNTFKLRRDIESCSTKHYKKGTIPYYFQSKPKTFFRHTTEANNTATTTANQK